MAASGYNVRVGPQGVWGSYPDWLREVLEPLSCRIDFEPVPWARMLSMFFDSQESDLFVPASRTPRRDAFAEFVPLTNLRTQLISRRSQGLQIGSLRDLARPDGPRLSVVRGFSWGEAYDGLLPVLESQRRLDLQPDISTVLRLMRGGRAEATLLPPSLFFAGMDEAGHKPSAQDWRYQSLSDLPATVVGAYLSPRLEPALRNRLRQVLLAAARDGRLRRSLQRHYPPEILALDLLTED